MGDNIEQLTTKLDKLYDKQMACMDSLNELTKDMPIKKIQSKVTPVFEKTIPNKKLSKLLQLDVDKPISNIDLGRKLMIYCKKNNLIKEGKIKCNDALNKIFEEESMDLHRIQYYLSEIDT